ncbi:PrgI family protein [Candidatus Berkelbacteria bacterium]|nr:PrgI family protein [Candidatus Berkelbacteria bacterium]
MRYRVPQNIDMEDRIIGPLTMAQFVYLMLGGMIIYVSYLLFIPPVFFAIAFGVGILTLSMTFLKIQDQPFPKFIAATLLYLVKPKQRTWQKDPTLQHMKVIEKTATTPEQKSVPGQTVTKIELNDLSQLLDTGGRIEPQKLQTQPALEEKSKKIDTSWK